MAAVAVVTLPLGVSVVLISMSCLKICAGLGTVGRRGGGERRGLGRGAEGERGGEGSCGKEGWESGAVHVAQLYSCVMRKERTGLQEAPNRFIVMRLTF